MNQMLKRITSQHVMQTPLEELLQVSGVLKLELSPPTMCHTIWQISQSRPSLTAVPRASTACMHTEPVLGSSLPGTSLGQEVGHPDLLKTHAWLPHLLACQQTTFLLCATIYDCADTTDYTDRSLGCLIDILHINSGYVYTCTQRLNC